MGWFEPTTPPRYATGLREQDDYVFIFSELIFGLDASRAHAGQKKVC